MEGNKRGKGPGVLIVHHWLPSEWLLASLSSSPRLQAVSCDGPGRNAAVLWCQNQSFHSYISWAHDLSMYNLQHVHAPLICSVLLT